MANRAYLYAADSVPKSEWILPDTEYFDSRWTFPFAWWFLFCPDDLHFADVYFEGSTWQSLKFVTDKVEAIARFNSKRGILETIIADCLDARYIDYFIGVLSAWPGKYLLMDPDEIFEDDPHDEAAKITPILDAFNTRDAICADLLECTNYYSAIEPKDRADVLIVGATYGPTGQKLWGQIMPTEP